MWLNLIYFLVIGLAAGWLAGRLMSWQNMGLVGNLVVGIIGALVGGFMFGLLGIQTMTMLGSLVSAVVGAMVLLFLLQKINIKGWPCHPHGT